MPAAELCDRPVTVEEVSGRPAIAELRDRLAAAATGAVAIGDLGVAAGVSSTHLARRFKEIVGVTPKRPARTDRFAATVLAIDPVGPVDWIELAGRAPEAWIRRSGSWCCATSRSRSPATRCDTVHGASRG
jgi:AraC-like DNA-binding protein